MIKRVLVKSKKPSKMYRYLFQLNMLDHTVIYHTINPSLKEACKAVITAMIKQSISLTFVNQLKLVKEECITS